MSKALPFRSWLFVPGDRPERFPKALSSHADAVILDLEDGVADGRREEAIEYVEHFLRHHPKGERSSIWVRVDDAESRHPTVEKLTRLDSLDGIVIPKFENSEQCAGWNKPVLAIVETPRGIVDATSITRAAATDLHGIALGSEDLSAALGVNPCFESMVYAASTVAFAAHAAGVQVYCCPGSISEFRNLNAWRATLDAGRRIGSHGALCIHPAQIAPANLTFSPTSAEIEWAVAVCAAWERAEGRGAIAVDGKMVDIPVITRARLMLSRQRSVPP
jgi:citrate lyase subunit beta/citryl-CoA lyase